MPKMVKLCKTPETCGQTVLPDRSISVGVKSQKNQMRHISDFQPVLVL